MTPYPKRLIEVDLPIARISTHARAEKESRQGHIPQLLIYPAARPVAACRAVVLASLWPDPVDLSNWAKDGDVKGEVRAPKGESLKSGEGVVIRPKRFLEEARLRMSKWAQIGLHKSSPESYRLMVQVQKNPKLLDDPAQLRAMLLDFIADFASLDHSTDKDYLDTSRALVLAAHEALGGEAGTRPMVIDPFAGGGAIPLESLRVGADAFATDLNPISNALNRILAVHIPALGDSLPSALAEWCEEIQEEARRRLQDVFPQDEDGSQPIAYLWARTVLSEAPSPGELPVEVPAMKTLWLAKKGQLVALRWCRDGSGAVSTKTVEVRYADGSTRRVRRPQLEIFFPKASSEVEPGTVRRGSITCPVTAFTTPADRVRTQIRARHGGSEDARMYCVVVDRPSGERVFRVATSRDDKYAKSVSERLAKLCKGSQRPAEVLLPETTPKGGGRGAGRAFSQQAFGMMCFGDLFTPRQLLALTTYAELSRSYLRKHFGANDPMKEAMADCIGLVLGRLADQNAALTTWQLNTKNAAHVFTRWAMQMVWDFAEVNPLSSAGGSPDSALRRMVRAIESLTKARLPKGHVQQASADAHPLPDDSANVLFTDPPYYDAIPYSDLLDFFFVWLRRVRDEFESADARAGLCPKDDECIVDEVKGKDPAYFESMMTRCLAEQRRVVAGSGIGVIVFAHKSTSGWERLLQAVIDAGWSITGSWPIDTELALRLRAQGSAALASSVHLVCRPREAARGSRAATIGEWREVLHELPKRIDEWMPRLGEEGVVGADAIFACLGPALEIFSRYSRVEKANGEQVKLSEYLEHVWAAVSSEALSMIFKDADAAGLEPDARLTAMWLWTIGGGKSQATGVGETAQEDVSSDEEEDAAVKKPKVAGFVLEFDAARKIAQGLGIHLEKSESIVEVKGDSARLLPVSERTRYLFGKDAEEDRTNAKGRKAKTKPKQGSLFEELDAIEAKVASTGGRFGGLEAAKPGATVLDKVHQSMILFAAGRGEALKRFLVEDGVGKDGRFWKLAQSFSALYPSGTDEKRWVDGVLARKKGLGF